ncbi:Forkhead transcription factor HCM1 [Rhodotorula toruloides]|uniref:BY PROTMAP: gi/647394641/emb/CDR35874.1/ RHTO0S01e09142g1_1 [Rhodosporidium toruloides] n=1 Tax=Rhodotorula toruloides TaxID=5286 RepID=A0A0K3CE41_RHOTO|nr:Forkhead transcription factor HCM1 [Rhodotorula toruloides]
MPSRALSSPAPPSSSAFGQSTPALVHRHAHLDASSSSPSTDVIATPSDRHDAPYRTRNGKQGPRRSVRIRTSSNGLLDSSPQIGSGHNSSFFADSDHEALPELPTRSRATRKTAEAIALAASVPAPSSRTSRASRASLSANVQPALDSVDALALAQAHGITPDQFEEAKQQVMRFLRTDPSGASAAAAISLPALPHDPRSHHVVDLHLQSSVSPVLASASTSFAASPAQAPVPWQQSLSRTPTTSNGLQAAFELESSATRARPRSAFDDVVARSVKRQKRDQGLSGEAAVRQWAQEDSSSSSEEDSAAGIASALVSRRVGGTPRNAGSPGAAASGAQDASPSVQGQRGMMDRFMQSQPAHAAAAPEATVPQVEVPPSTAGLPKPSSSAAAAQMLDTAVEQRHPPVPEQPKTSPTFAHASPASPVRKTYPQHALMSPRPSKPASSVLFSPDVARLLRSELDELEANELAGRKSLSPRKQVDRSSDIVVDDVFSSPYRRNASPFSSGGASRSRNIFSSSQENSAVKRARWTAFSSMNDAGPTSPSPSNGSLSMRAPSFCDSSPAASERGSITSRPHAFPASAAEQTHPASAPDFLYGAIPSSSPASSQHSEYIPARYSRSSPGPAARPRSDSSSTVGGDNKRPAPRRNDTYPIFVPPTTTAQQKPPFSYAALIGQALFSTPDLRMALADIYVWIMQTYPFFKKGDAGWQNSIRHNLSLNPCFIKTARGPDNPGKGCLWAIKPGTEDQFVNGDFVRKAGQAPGRKRTKGGSSQQQTSGSSGSDSQTPPRSSKARSVAAATSAQPAPAPRQLTPSVASSRGDSPAPTVVSRTSSAQKTQTVQAPVSVAAFSPTPSVTSFSSLTPAAMSPPTHSTQLQPPVQITNSIPRPASAASIQRVEPEQSLAPPASLARSHSSLGCLEHTAPVSAPAEQSEYRLAPPAMLERTASAPMLASRSAPGDLSAPPVSPPRLQSSHSLYSNLHEPLLSVTMSPPTSVYHRLAGPYQPLSYGNSVAQNHRALALLASPEAPGIIAGRTGERAAATLLSVATSSSPTAGPSSAPFLPAPHIFPGGISRKRQRTDSEKGDRSLQGMLSPTALVHTQSPISSVRGGPRTPMSPVQDKLEPIADPEKKSTGRATGTRLLPSVNALANSDFDPFRSPPPSSNTGATIFGSAKYQLRSPSARLQAALSTPGNTKGRVPLGFSPSLATGASWEGSTATTDSPAWGDLYDADLGDHFGRHGAGGRTTSSSWPSPGTGVPHAMW